MKKGKNRIQNLQVAADAFGEKLSEWITPKRLAIFLTIIYLVSLIPLLWISFYNYPSADDYSIGSNCRQMWVSSHNVFAVLWAGVVRAVEDWLYWMGYFTSNFLMALPPNVFGERFYVLTAWIMLSMLSLSTWYLLKNIFVKVFHVDKDISHCIIMFMLFITVQCMVGRVEAFYWYAGAANYMLIHSLSLFFYGLLIAAIYDKGKKRVFDLVSACILGFLVGGGNQMTALNVAIVMLVVIGFGIAYRKWKEYKYMLIPIGCALFGFVLNVAAPGNWVRAEGTDGMNPIKAVMVSFYYCLDCCMDEWTGWPVLLFIIVLIPLFWKAVQKTQFSFSYPLVVVLFGYCLISAMLTPPLFAVGNIESARLQALTFTMYILVLTLCEGYIVGYIRRRLSIIGHKEDKTVQITGKKFTASEIWCIAGCILFFGMASVLTIIPEPYYFTASSAMTDLMNGSAKAYGDVLKGRMELYNSGEKNVVVQPLPAQPELLYFSDIKETPEDWENKGLCRFYGLESVVVATDDRH